MRQFEVYLLPRDRFAQHGSNEAGGLASCPVAGGATRRGTQGPASQRYVACLSDLLCCARFKRPRSSGGESSARRTFRIALPWVPPYPVLRTYGGQTETQL